jgi:hypothetical protein
LLAGIVAALSHVWKVLLQVRDATVQLHGVHVGALAAGSTIVSGGVASASSGACTPLCRACVHHHLRVCTTALALQAVCAHLQVRADLLVLHARTHAQAATLRSSVAGRFPATSMSACLHQRETCLNFQSADGGLHDLQLPQLSARSTLLVTAGYRCFWA